MATTNYVYTSGTVVRVGTDPTFSPPGAPFTSISGVLVNPDVVTFSYSYQGQTVVTYTWTNGQVPPDPSYKIVKDSTGVFHIDIDTTGYEGVCIYTWEGAPGLSGLDATKTQVVAAGTFTVSPNPL